MAAAAVAAAAAAAAVGFHGRLELLVRPCSISFVCLLLLGRPHSAVAAAAAAAAATAQPAFANQAAAAAAGKAAARDDHSSSYSSLVVDRDLSPGEHNVLLLLLLLLAGFWVLKLLPRLASLLHIRKQLAVQPEALMLAGFGEYKAELQQLLRIHFSKLLQQIKPAAAAAMPLIEVKGYAFDASPLSHGEITEDVELQQQQQQQLDCERPPPASNSSSSVFAVAAGRHNRRSSSSNRRGRSNSSSSSIAQQREALLEECCAVAAGTAAPSAAATRTAATTAAAAAAAALAGGGFEVFVDAAETSAVRVYWGLTQKAMDAFLKGSSSDLDSLLSGPARRLACFLPSSSSSSSSSSSRRKAQHEAVELCVLEGRSNTHAAALGEAGSVSWGPDDFCLSSPPQIVPAGYGHRVRFFTHHPVETYQPSMQRMQRRGEASSHVLLLRCRPLPLPPPSTSSRSRLSPAAAAAPAADAAAAARSLPSCYISHRFEVYRQLLTGRSLTKPQEKGDVFGVSSSSGSFDVECLVCMTNPKNVVLYPCRHCALCVECLQALHQEKCPVCRSPFFAFIIFPLNKSFAAADASVHSPAAAAAAADGAATESHNSSSSSSSNAAPGSLPLRGSARVVPTS
ncbi:hypothetical protein Esti_006706 [Eimeria stiedai]